MMNNPLAHKKDKKNEDVIITKEFDSEQKPDTSDLKQDTQKDINTMIQFQDFID